MFTPLTRCGYCPKHERELGPDQMKYSHNECCFCDPLNGDEERDGCSDNPDMARIDVPTNIVITD